MASKLQLYSEQAERVSTEITRDRKSWTAFLGTAARLYKYPFPDQLMIYAQRPDATACATIEDWNNDRNRRDFDGQPWHRFVRRGAKGIALVDDSGEYPRIKYVFDISDTESFLRDAGRPFRWAMRQEYEAPVLEALVKTYEGVEDSLGVALYTIAIQLVREYDGDKKPLKT